MPSTAAVTAASQAGDYYASQLSDKLPELYESAYGRYLDEFNILGSKLSALQGREETGYARFLDEINFQQKQAAQTAAILAAQEAAEESPASAEGLGNQPNYIEPYYIYDDTDETPDKSSEEAIAQAAARYYKEHPNVKVDSRTLDNWLNANGYSGKAAQTFKAYLEYYGAGYERGYRK
jgi:hypothetical protein